ncbi:MAG: hypothetical protein AAGE52_18855, partial [Myxococcota bacterium]
MHSSPTERSDYRTQWLPIAVGLCLNAVVLSFAMRIALVLVFAATPVFAQKRSADSILVTQEAAGRPNAPLAVTALIEAFLDPQNTILVALDPNEIIGRRIDAPLDVDEVVLIGTDDPRFREEMRTRQRLEALREEIGRAWREHESDRIDFESGPDRLTNFLINAHWRGDSVLVTSRFNGGAERLVGVRGPRLAAQDLQDNPTAVLARLCAIGRSLAEGRCERNPGPTQLRSPGDIALQAEVDSLGQLERIDVLRGPAMVRAERPTYVLRQTSRFRLTTSIYPENPELQFADGLVESNSYLTVRTSVDDTTRARIQAGTAALIIAHDGAEISHTQTEPGQYVAYLTATAGVQTISVELRESDEQTHLDSRELWGVTIVRETTEAGSFADDKVIPFWTHEDVTRERLGDKVYVRRVADAHIPIAAVAIGAL